MKYFKSFSSEKKKTHSQLTVTKQSNSMCKRLIYVVSFSLKLTNISLIAHFGCECRSSTYFLYFLSLRSHSDTFSAQMAAVKERPGIMFKYTYNKKVVLINVSISSLISLIIFILEKLQTVKGFFVSGKNNFGANLCRPIRRA